MRFSPNRYLIEVIFASLLMVVFGIGASFNQQRVVVDECLDYLPDIHLYYLNIYNHDVLRSLENGIEGAGDFYSLFMEKGFGYEFITNVTKKSSVEVVALYPVDIRIDSSIEEYRAKGGADRKYSRIPLKKNLDILSYQKAALVISFFSNAEEIPNLEGAQEDLFILDNLRIPIYKTTVSEKTVFYAVDNNIMINSTMKIGVLHALQAKYGLEAPFLDRKADSLIHEYNNEFMFSLNYAGEFSPYEIAKRIYDHNNDAEKLVQVQTLIDKMNFGRSIIMTSYDGEVVSWIRVDECSDNETAREKLKGFKEILAFNDLMDNEMSQYRRLRNSKTNIIQDGSRIIQTLSYDKELFASWVSALKFSRKMREEGEKYILINEKYKDLVDK